MLRGRNSRVQWGARRDMIVGMSMALKAMARLDLPCIFPGGWVLDSGGIM